MPAGESGVMYKTLCFVILLLPFLYTEAMAGEGPAVVKWVYMADAEPINWEENGIARGLEVEIVEHCLKKLNIKVVHRFLPWKRAQKMVESGEADAMMTTPTPERFKYAVFGIEHTLANYVNLFIRKSNTEMIEKARGFKKLDDLKPFKLIDYIGNGWTAAYMKKEDGYNIQEVAKLEQIPKLLLAEERCDLTINNSAWIRWWAEKKGVMEKIEEIDIDWPNTRAHFVFMVSRKSPWIMKGLIRAMDEELKKMKESGEWLKILKKYKDPHGLGKPFQTHLNEQYLNKNGFYEQYYSYPVYKP